MISPGNMMKGVQELREKVKEIVEYLYDEEFHQNLDVEDLTSELTERLKSLEYKVDMFEGFVAAVNEYVHKLQLGLEPDVPIYGD